MTVGPNTKIGNHTDNEGGWRYQLCLDDGGGDQSGMYVMNLETRKQELYTWKTGDAFVFQPDIQVHNGFNNNPGERTTLLKKSLKNITSTILNALKGWKI